MTKYCCKDCGKDRYGPIVADSIWSQITSVQSDFLCYRCMEIRLGRPITVDDLKPCGMNEYTITALLRERRRSLNIISQIREVADAIEERQHRQDDSPQHQEAQGRGQAPEAGRSGGSESSGEGQNEAGEESQVGGLHAEFREIILGWMLHDDSYDLLQRLTRIGKWLQHNTPTESELLTIKMMVETLYVRSMMGT